MKLGARVLKTGLSVAAAIHLSALAGLGPAIFAAIAATLSVQPSLYRTWRYVKDVILSNAIGASSALAMSHFFGSEPAVIGLTIILVIACNLQLKMEHAAGLSALTVIAIMMTDTPGPPLQFAGERFLLIMLGVLSSLAINALFFPPKFESRLYQVLSLWHTRSCLLLRSILTSSMPATVLREEKDWLSSQQKHARDLYDFYREDPKSTLRRSRRYPVMRKLVVYRQMISTLNKQKNLISSLEYHWHHLKENSSVPEAETTAFLLALTSYQERIFLKFEGKAKSSEHHEADPSIGELSRHAIKDLMELYQTGNSELWLHLFPIISQMVAIVEELDHLEMLVERHQTKHGN